MRVQTNSDLWLVDQIKGQWIEESNLQIGDTIGIFGGYEIETSNRLNFDRYFKCFLEQRRNSGEIPSKEKKNPSKFSKI